MTTGNRRVTRWIVLGGAFTCAGVAICVVGFWYDRTKLWNAGLVLFIFAALCAGQIARVRYARTFEEVWTTAYDQGYDDGAKHAAERIVHLHPRTPGPGDGRHKASSKRFVAGNGPPA